MRENSTAIIQSKLNVSLLLDSQNPDENLSGSWNRQDASKFKTVFQPAQKDVQCTEEHFNQWPCRLSFSAHTVCATANFFTFLSIPGKEREIERVKNKEIEREMKFKRKIEREERQKERMKKEKEREKEQMKERKKKDKKRENFLNLNSGMSREKLTASLPTTAHWQSIKTAFSWTIWIFLHQ